MAKGLLALGGPRGAQGACFPGKLLKSEPLSRASDRVRKKIQIMRKFSGTLCGRKC